MRKPHNHHNRFPHHFHHNHFPRRSYLVRRQRKVRVLAILGTLLILGGLIASIFYYI